MLTGILLANGNLSASILSSLFNENLVKEGNWFNLSLVLSAYFLSSQIGVCKLFSLEIILASIVVNQNVSPAEVNGDWEDADVNSPASRVDWVYL